MNLPNLIGLAGVTLSLLAYAMVATGRWSSTQPRYPLVNIIGTAMILYSLLFAWNLPAVVAQILWILFSVVGLIRYYRQRGRA